MWEQLIEAIKKRNIYEAESLIHRMTAEGIPDNGLLRQYSWELLPLHLAAERGSRKIVELLLDKDLNFILTDKYNYTPLYLAAEQGYEGVVELLLDKKPELINEVTKKKHVSGYNALHIAINLGHKNIVKLLLNKNPELINKTTGNNSTVLHVAAYHNQVDIATELLKIAPALISVIDMNGHTPLHLAVKNNLEDMVELLLGRNSNCNTKDNYGYTPLHWAIKLWPSEYNSKGNADKLELRKNEYITMMLFNKNPDLNVVDKNAQTTLHLAAKTGHKKIVQLLLGKSFSLIKLVDEYSNTALHLASQNGHLDIVKFLSDEEPSLINMVNKHGQTALYRAVSNGHLNIIEFLLNKDPFLINKVDQYSQTVLHIAAYNGYEKVVRSLIDKDPSLIDKVDKFGQTALHKAVMGSDPNILSSLIFKASSKVINTLDKEGKSLLHHVAKLKIKTELIPISAQNTDKKQAFSFINFKKSVEAGEIAGFILRKISAEIINTADNNGQTALHIAVIHRQEALVKLLTDKMNSIILRDNKDDTPIHLAIKSGQSAIAESLMDKIPPKFINDLLSSKDKDPNDLIVKFLNRLIISYDEILLPYQEPHSGTSIECYSTYIKKGNILYGLGKKEEAIKCYQEAMNINYSYHKGRHEESEAYKKMDISLLKILQELNITEEVLGKHSIKITDVKKIYSDNSITDNLAIEEKAIEKVEEEIAREMEKYILETLEELNITEEEFNKQNIKSVGETKNDANPKEAVDRKANLEEIAKRIERNQQSQEHIEMKSQESIAENPNTLVKVENTEVQLNEQVVGSQINDVISNGVSTTQSSYTLDKVKKLLDVQLKTSATIMLIDLETDEDHDKLLREKIEGVTKDGKTVVIPLHLQKEKWVGIIVKKKEDDILQLIYSDPSGRSFKEEEKAKCLINKITEIADDFEFNSTRVDLQKNQSTEMDSSILVVENLVKLAKADTTKLKITKLKELVPSIETGSLSIDSIRIKHSVIEDTNPWYSNRKFEEILKIVLKNQDIICTDLFDLKAENISKEKIKALINSVIEKDIPKVIPIHLNEKEWAGLVIKKQNDGVQLIYNAPNGFSFRKTVKANALITKITKITDDLEINSCRVDLQKRQLTSSDDSSLFTIENLVLFSTTETCNLRKNTLIELLNAPKFTNASSIREGHAQALGISIELSGADTILNVETDM